MSNKPRGAAAQQAAFELQMQALEDRHAEEILNINQAMHVQQQEHAEEIARLIAVIAEQNKTLGEIQNQRNLANAPRVREVPMTPVQFTESEVDAKGNLVGGLVHIGDLSPIPVRARRTPRNTIELFVSERQTISLDADGVGSLPTRSVESVAKQLAV